MKYSFLSLILILFFAGNINAQGYVGGGKNPSKKIENLEKIKLIETLKLDGDNSVRFFARRDEHNRKLREISKQSEEVIEKMNKLLNDKPEKNSVELKKLSDESLKLDKQMSKERISYVSSLYDILTNEQVAKLIVFERNFKKEIRNFLIKEREKDSK
jgi:hypothetical protein